HVWVSPDSVVYKNGILLNDTTSVPSQNNYYQYRHLLKLVFNNKRVRLDDRKKYMLVTDNWSNGHYHWVCEVLPKLISIKHVAKEFVLLLPDKPYINTIGRESLELLGIHFNEIVLMKEKEVYKVPGLFYIPQMTKKGLHDETMTSIRDSFMIRDLQADKKIYISRAGTTHRKVKNESSLLPLLKDRGFAIYDGEAMSLKDQLALFSTCNTLMGIHGAGLANCIFMKKGARLVELRKKESNNSNTGYWHLADSLGLGYYYFNGIPDSENPLIGNGCNLEIPVADFEKKILNLV
ncbi:MAG TPA: glycosyltransferase family 61 protein, partial [Chitinophagaceae bacterium]|nr:glycosyltransferase family 61 protein [Chitinophagaceae bacterium]